MVELLNLLSVDSDKVSRLFKDGTENEYMIQRLTIMKEVAMKLKDLLVKNIEKYDPYLISTVEKILTTCLRLNDEQQHIMAHELEMKLKELLRHAHMDKDGNIKSLHLYEIRDDTIDISDEEMTEMGKNLGLMS